MAGTRPSNQDFVLAHQLGLQPLDLAVLGTLRHFVLAIVGEHRLAVAPNSLSVARSGGNFVNLDGNDCAGLKIIDGESWT